jgi:hypothetical protein
VNIEQQEAGFVPFGVEFKNPRFRQGRQRHGRERHSH